MVVIGLALTLALLSLAALTALHFEWDLFRRRVHPWLEIHATLLSAYRSLVALVSFPLLLLGAYLTLLELRTALARPDAVLVFAEPQSPLFKVINDSDAVMRDAKYGFHIYDLDAVGDEDGPLNLLIPFQSLEPIRPQAGMGPWTIESLSLRKDGIKPGHRLFGWASISCPECLRRRVYWIYSKFGEEGWYAEIPDAEQARVQPNLARIVNSDDPENLIERVVPSRARVPLIDLQLETPWLDEGGPGSDGN